MTSSIVKRLLTSAGVALMALAAIVSARTAPYMPSSEPPHEAVKRTVPAGAAERLAGAIRIATLSQADGTTDLTTFQRLHGHLKRAFPRVHSTLQREIVNRHSLLFTWRGADASLKPILLMGHLDVVPVEPGTHTKWQHDPFMGFRDIPTEQTPASFACT